MLILAFGIGVLFVVALKGLTLVKKTRCPNLSVHLACRKKGLTLVKIPDAQVENEVICVLYFLGSSKVSPVLEVVRI